MPKKYDAVIFDLDGTLIDSGVLIAESVRRTFADYGLPVPEKKTVISYMGVPVEIYFEKLGGPEFLKLNSHDTYMLYHKYFRQMLDEGLLKSFPGIPGMLRDLQSAGIYTGVATSKHSKPAEYSCEKAGISDCLDVIIGSDMVQAYKPAPDTVYKCLELLGIGCGKNVMVVGDAEGDIAMGNNAGAVTCCVTYGAHDEARLRKQNPDYIADNAIDLRKLLLI
jgi:HAD superfamily hydrolase (TIGR01549 family)